MADSPSLNSSEVLAFTITSNGSAIAETHQLLSIEVNKTVNKLSSARLVIIDGNMPDECFPASDGTEFIPGAKLVISAGYGSTTEQIFSGVVVKHAVKISGNNEARLIVECRHEATAMTLGRRSANYVDKKDSDIITSMIGATSGLSSTVDATTVQYGEMVQFNSSNWDFMLARAEANGLIVITEDGGKVVVQKPATSGSAVLTVTYGSDLLSFHGELDARFQLAKVHAVSWDPATLAAITSDVTPVTLNSQGNIDSATLAKVLGVDQLRLQSMAALDSATIKNWATAQQTKAGLARVRGSMRFQGSSKALPGTLIEIVGVGERFSGDVFVSAVRHSIESGDWFTEVDFGMEPEWFGDRASEKGAMAPGVTPAATGLHVGTVKKLDADPGGMLRIQVEIPVMEATTVGVWARLASFHGSNAIGAYFIPEIGDEVIVGYFDNDPSHPVVLGSLYSKTHAMPYPLSADNYMKAILTKAKLLLEFDDENKVITLVTPAKNTVIISDKDKSITLKDQTGNSVVLGTSGIVLDSPKDIAMTATGKITLSATGNVEVTSKADVKTSGLNVNNDAKVGFVAKGAATAEVQASGQVTIKGAMVMIN